MSNNQNRRAWLMALLMSSTPLATAYNANQGFQGGTSPWTLTAVGTGTANALRKNIAGIHAPSTSTANLTAVTAVTINGQTGSLIGNRQHPASNFHETCFWVAANASGTSGNVVITGGTRASMNCNAMFSVNESYVVVDEQIDVTPSAATLSVTVNCPAGGTILAIHGRQSGSGTTTWGGTAGVSEVSDNPLSGSQASNSVQSAAFVNKAAGGSYTVTCTPSASSTTQILHVLVLGPAP